MYQAQRHRGGLKKCSPSGKITAFEGPSNLQPELSDPLGPYESKGPSCGWGGGHPRAIESRIQGCDSRAGRQAGTADTSRSLGLTAQLVSQVTDWPESERPQLSGSRQSMNRVPWWTGACQHGDTSPEPHRRA